MRRASTLAAGFFLVTLCGAGAAWALPSAVTATATSDDATVTVTTLDQAILGDARSRCTVQVVVLGEDVPFSAGDTVNVWVREDDLTFDETLWETSFEVTAQEIAAQRVERSFDCSSDFGEDGVGDTEIYGEAEVIKDECGFFCLQDNPETSNLALAEVEDDEAEEDDSRGDAVMAGGAAGEGRISRDQDWIEFSAPGAFHVTFEAVHTAAYGRLDVALFNSNDQRVGEGDDEAGATTLSVRDLPAGQYFLRISPRQSNDFNFYDWQLAIDQTAGACAAGEIERQPCGNCGMRARACDAGVWGPYGACMDEGECAPGDERTAVCGNCGTQAEVCSAQCAWQGQGECMGQGVCARGAQEMEDCGGDAGTRARTCDDACMWGEFSECNQGGACEEGMLRGCYDGAEGTAGVGVCREGRQRCENGAWTLCQGQITPANERCTDARDNDCDGQTDIADTDCADEGAEIGSACEESAECAGGLLCLRPPAHGQFTDGYCGDDDCDQDADCGPDGVCAEAFGQTYCLRVCAGLPDCRRGYVCAPVRDELRACIPRCTSDADCEDADAPRCDSSSGYCVAGAPNNGDPNNGQNNGQNNGDPVNNGDPNNGDPNNGDVDLNNGAGPTPPPATPADSGCCAVAPARPAHTPWPAVALTALGLALLARRRR